MLYQLRGEIHRVRLDCDAALAPDAVEPRVHAVVAHPVELLHETADGALAAPGVAVEVQDGGGLVDEVDFGGGHAGDEGLDVGGDGGGKVVERAVEGVLRGGGGGGFGGRRGVVWEGHRRWGRWDEMRMRDVDRCDEAFMHARDRAWWYAWDEQRRRAGDACMLGACGTGHAYIRSIHRISPLHRISISSHLHLIASTMGFFKRKNAPLIPPVAPTAGQQPNADPYAAPAAGGYGGDPYTQSKPRPAAGESTEKGGGDPYAATPVYAAGGDPYAKRNPGPRANPNAANDAARAELFGRYKAADVPAERKYGYEGREMEEDFDEDEEIEGIKQEMRGVKQDSLASTRCVSGFPVGID